MKNNIHMKSKNKSYLASKQSNDCEEEEQNSIVRARKNPRERKKIGVIWLMTKSILVTKICISLIIL